MPKTINKRTTPYHRSPLKDASNKQNLPAFIPQEVNKPVLTVLPAGTITLLIPPTQNVLSPSAPLPPPPSSPLEILEIMYPISAEGEMNTIRAQIPPSFMLSLTPEQLGYLTIRLLPFPPETERG
jgi:hypothetical protein